jgi:hypothetical protein
MKKLISVISYTISLIANILTIVQILTQSPEIRETVYSWLKKRFSKLHNLIFQILSKLQQFLN